jgi:hypothetical protein
MITLGPEAGPMGQIWAFDRGTVYYLGTRGWSHGTNMGLL